MVDADVDRFWEYGKIGKFRRLSARIELRQIKRGIFFLLRNYKY